MVAIGAIALAVAAAAPAAAATHQAPSRQAAAKSSRHGSSHNPQGPVTPIKSAGGRHPQIVAGGQISTSEVYSRAMAWVNANVPYNQNAYVNAPSDPVGPYRTDCSGFISMAWGLAVSTNTQGLATSQYTTQITKDQLRLGDIIDYNSSINPGNGSHVVMFVSWANSAHTQFTELEVAGGGLGAVQRTIAYPYDVSMDGSGSWIPYRYNNIVAPPAWHTAPTYTANPSSNQQDIFWTGTDHQLYIAEYNTGQTDWAAFPTTWKNVASSPSAAEDNNGNLWVVWTGTDSYIHEAWRAGGTNTWNTRTFTQWSASGAPAFTVNPTTDRQDMFWKGSDGQMYIAEYTPGDTDWVGFPTGWKNVQSSPSAAEANNSDLWVTWTGTDNVIHEGWRSGGTNTWNTRVFSQWQLVGAPGFTVNPVTHQQDMFWTGPDHQLFIAEYTPGGNGWVGFPTGWQNVQSSPSTAENNNSDLRVVWTGSDDLVHEGWRAGGTNTWKTRTFNWNVL